MLYIYGMEQKINTHIEVIIYSENPLAAIIFRYDSDIDNCPVVIDKINTANDMQILKKTAVSNNIPIVQKPELAVNLFKLEIEEEIPPLYWEEVVKVLTEIVKKDRNNKITKKRRFINRLTSLSGEQKQYITEFFSKHHNYEKLIDWNKKNLIYNDFKHVFSLAAKSKTSRKKEKKINPVLLFKDHNCKIISQTNDYLIVVPLDWECAVYFNSFLCGGEGAKWCIGNKNTKTHWNCYSENGYTFFLVYFIQKHPSLGKKIIIELNHEYNYWAFWLQNDTGWDLLSVLPERLIENKVKNPFNICLKLWYYHLQSEKKRIGQLYIDFGDIVSSGIVDEEIPDAVFVKNILPLIIHDDITFDEIEDDVFDNSVKQLFLDTFEMESKNHCILPNPLRVEISYALIPLAEELLEQIKSMCQQIYLDMGIDIPIKIADNMSFYPYEYCIKIRGVNVGKGSLGEEISGIKPDRIIIKSYSLIITTHLEKIIRTYPAECF